jgi:hypothetical protein
MFKWFLVCNLSGNKQILCLALLGPPLNLIDA